MTTYKNHGSSDGPKLLALIPKEHRLPGALFFVVEAVFVAIASGPDRLVKIFVIVGMVVVACVFLIRFFPHTRGKSERHQKAYITPWIQSINEAQKRVQMFGINFLGSLHDTRGHLIKLLNHGGEIRVLLLDKDSAAFRQREISEGQHPSGTISGRLRAESIASLETIRDINMFKTAGNLELRVYDESPTSSILIVDEEFLLHNSYPKVKDRDDPADVSISPGIEGGIEKYCSGDGDGLFNQKADEFEDQWARASPVELS